MVRGVAAVALSVSVLGGVFVVPVAAVNLSAVKFANCAALLEGYPNGVAKSRKARNAAVREGFARPKVSKSLYKTNGARLDRDKDGVMCEQNR